jgi:RHS repeat-associated protein
MSNSPLKTVLSRYFYDPLDRQTDCTLHQQPAIQRFNCKDQLATEIQGNARRSILQCDNRLLAQLNDLDAKLSTTLLATDQQRSVLNALDANQPNPLAYSPYGHRPAESGLLSLLGFNGERPDPVTGHYHLGNGYRQFNPVLMRFNSPDSWSPFGEGGVNAYAYCGGEPTNRADPTGHYFKFFNFFDNSISVFKIPRPKLSAKTISTAVGDSTATAQPGKTLTNAPPRSNSAGASLQKTSSQTQDFFEELTFHNSFESFQKKVSKKNQLEQHFDNLDSSARYWEDEFMKEGSRTRHSETTSPLYHNYRRNADEVKSEMAKIGEKVTRLRTSLDKDRETLLFFKRPMKYSNIRY